MKTPMALVLSLGMVLLGTAPVVASGQVRPFDRTANTDGSSFIQIAIPEPLVLEELGDKELDEVDGEGVFAATAGAVGGFIGGAIGGAIGAAVHTYVQNGNVDYAAVGANMLGGAIGGAITGAIVGAVVPGP